MTPMAADSKSVSEIIRGWGANFIGNRETLAIIERAEKLADDRNAANEKIMRCR